MITKNIITNNLFISICISAILISCSSDNKSWKIAKLNNDIISYEYYLENSSNGKYADSARIFIDEIILTQTKKPTSLPLPLTPPIAFWNNMIVDSICLQIAINSEPRSKEFEIKTETNYFNYFKETLAKSGITVVPKNTICKTNMIITLSVIALGANYTNIGYRYSGYEVKGKISLSTDGQIPIALSISERKAIPETILESGTQQQFNKMFNTEHGSPGYSMPNLKLGDFADFIYKVWGKSQFIWIGVRRNADLKFPEYKGQLSKYDNNIILRACYSDDIGTRLRAMTIIKSENLPLNSETIISLVTYNISNYGLQTEIALNGISIFNLVGLDVLDNMDSASINVVPILIKYIENRRKKGWYDNSKIEKKLEIITGINYKSDVASWKEWWFKNKQNLLYD